MDKEKKSFKLQRELSEMKDRYMKAMNEGDRYFPFNRAEEDIKNKNIELKFAKFREWVEWWEFMIPKNSVLKMLDELEND